METTSGDRVMVGLGTNLNTATGPMSSGSGLRSGRFFAPAAGGTTAVSEPRTRQGVVVYPYGPCWAGHRTGRRR